MQGAQALPMLPPEQIFLCSALPFLLLGPRKAMKTEAIAYLCTSSVANVGADKDSEKRQRTAIAAFAKAHGYEVVDTFYDAAVSGADPVGERPGFRAIVERIEGNGVRAVIVESPDRFARDLAVQIAGHDFLKGRGVALVPTSAPDFLTEGTPTAVLMRQSSGPSPSSKRRRSSPG
jgi:DNA invertase Pin-like site-specific DNA recombinase